MISRKISMSSEITICCPTKSYAKKTKVLNFKIKNLCMQKLSISSISSSERQNQKHNRTTENNPSIITRLSFSKRTSITKKPLKSLINLMINSYRKADISSDKKDKF